MSNTPRQPRPDDAVLGGQTPQVPMDAAVLGGIEGVKQRFATDDLTFKKLAIKEALNYGDKGIELLFELMDKERNLEVQWFTYQTLYQQNNPTLQARLEKYFPIYEFEYACRAGTTTPFHTGETTSTASGVSGCLRPPELALDTFALLPFVDFRPVEISIF